MVPRLPWRALPLLGSLALAVAPAPAGAHDLWLEPVTFRAEPGARLAVRIQVGHGPGDAHPVPRRDGWIERFVCRGPAGETAVPGVAGVDPAGFAELAGPGLYAVGLETSGTRHTLTAGRFARFLAEEGLERWAAAHGAAADRDGFAREVFARSVKALLHAGAPAAAGGFDRPLGLELELVPLADPFDPAARELVLRVLHRGRPAAGVLVDLRPLDPGAPAGAAAAVAAVSDAGGRVRLPLPAPPATGGADAWLAAAVVLEPAPSGTDARWRSVWTSLTFARGSND